MTPTLTLTLTLTLIPVPSWPHLVFFLVHVNKGQGKDERQIEGTNPKMMATARRTKIHIVLGRMRAYKKLSRRAKMAEIPLLRSTSTKLIRCPFSFSCVLFATREETGKGDNGDTWVMVTVGVRVRVRVIRIRVRVRVTGRTLFCILHNS